MATVDTKKFLDENGLKQLVSILQSKFENVNGTITTKANTADVYKKAEIYTKGEVDELIEGIDVTEQLENYATKDYVDGAIEDLDISQYAKKSEIPTDFYTKAEVNEAVGKVKSEILGGAGGDYDTLKEIEDWVVEHQDLYEALVRGIATKADKEEVEESFGNVYKKSEVYTQEEVNALIEDIDVTDQLKDYAKKTEVTSEIEEAVGKIIAISNEEITSLFEEIF